MNLLYKSVKLEKTESFQYMYYTFSDDEDEEIRFCAAQSLHEAFRIIEDDDDTSRLRSVFIGLITEN